MTEAYPFGPLDLGKIPDSFIDLAEARGRARRFLQESGLPGKKDEYWKYTSPPAPSGESYEDRNMALREAFLASSGAVGPQGLDGEGSAEADPEARERWVSRLMSLGKPIFGPPPKDAAHFLMPSRASASFAQGFEDTECEEAEEPSEFVEAHKDNFIPINMDEYFDSDSMGEIVEIGSRCGVEMLMLHVAMLEPWFSDFYGELESRGQEPVKRPYAALNTACAMDGIGFKARKKAKKPVLIHYSRDTSEFNESMIHHCVVVDPGASLTMIEYGVSSGNANHVMEVDIGEGGEFHHIRIQPQGEDDTTITHIFARQAARSVLKSFTLTTGGKMTRNECFIDIDGEEAVTHVAGAALGKGDFHHDDTVFITHRKEACESRQVFKKALVEGAKGVFQGKILVKPEAQKTDGYQISQSLLLDGSSQFFAKPELEIYADDVKCSHGSTSGALDEESLFYLSARGIKRAEAERMLTLAFLMETLDEIEDEGVRGRVQAELEARLAEEERDGFFA